MHNDEQHLFLIILPITTFVIVSSLPPSTEETLGKKPATFLVVVEGSSTVTKGMLAKGFAANIGAGRWRRNGESCWWDILALMDDFCSRI